MDVLLQGVQPAPLAVQQISLETVGKWLAGNEVWALALLDASEDTPVSDGIPEKVQELLSEYQDVFAEPQGLPPERLFDHDIPTLPGAIPVNSRPYMYSPLHKDETE